jgi:radical SAM protein with 4Fe4S-binding SPASM domain
MVTPTAFSQFELVLTAGCNLRCSYCYQNDKKARRMEWDTLRAAADLVLASTRPEVGVLFVGGEPLLQFKLIQEAVDYIETRRAPAQRIDYQINTNGTLLRREHIDFFIRHGFQVQLSFDGVPVMQDLRGPTTFGILDSLLDQLKAELPAFLSEHLRIAITLLPATIPYLGESILYFLDKGVEDIAIGPSMTHQPWRLEQIDELDAQFEKLLILCLHHHRRTGKVPLSCFQGNDEHLLPLDGAMCGAARGQTASIDVDGQVSGCVTFAESYQTFPTSFLKSRLEAMRMGNVSDTGLAGRIAAYPAAARAAGIFHRKGHKYSSYGVCRECRFLASCGICPVSIGHQPANEDPDRIPDFLCAYNLVSLKYAEQFRSHVDYRAVLVGPRPRSQLVRELLSRA